MRKTPEQSVRDEVSPGDSVLSLCCGIALELRRLPGGNEVTAVDIVPEYIAEVNRLYPEYKTTIADAVEYISKAPDKSFDVVSCIDGVEHLKKEDGWKLLRECRRVARKKVLIFTPQGHTKNEPEKTWGIEGGDHYQKHLSGWVPEELAKLDYRLIWEQSATTRHGEDYMEAMYVFDHSAA